MRGTLKLLADGLTPKQIAAKEKTSESAIHERSRVIRRKLDALTTTHAVVLALKRGLLVLMLCGTAWGAVAVDATYSGGDAHFASGTSFSVTGMTVGGSATCLTVGIAWSGSSTGISVTWNNTTMNAAAVEAQAGGTSAWFYLTNPASGNQTIAGSWTGSSDGYVTAVSWTGTDTGNCVKSADDVATTVTTVTVNSGTNDATEALCNWASSNCIPSDFTTIFATSAFTNFASATYALGGTSNAHTFGGTSSSGAGIHIVAPSGGATCPHTLSLTGAGCS